MSGWENFFIAEVGASAALLGLLFVGVSINLTRILSIPGLPNRAFLGLVILLTILVVSSLLLVPGQSLTLAGIEILIVGLIVWITATMLDVSILQKKEPHSGEIEAAGKEVTRFRKGDQVFAWSGLRLGAYAEYTCLPENGVLALKPSNIGYEEAAVLPVGGLDAVYFLRNVHIKSGQKVLINGAGGSIGTFAVQIARYFGAEVTAVDSTGKLDILRSIGANHVIDYTQSDFTRSGETYDVIFDVIGKSSFSRSLRLLTPNGRYLLGDSRMLQRVRGRWTSMSSSMQVIPWKARTASEYAQDIKFLTKLIEAGKIHSVIDRCYPLEQTAEAHRYVDTGHKKGNVVITVAQNNIF
jgi:NADPH:quinone reductase-like Zn-dependent oxidoreductase